MLLDIPPEITLHIRTFEYLCRLNIIIFLTQATV